ncbi:MAG: spermidine/putrescine transport system substrate-binding protein [Actinomycetota bacterium]|jgi:spermidine/putrescine transport system substrate-binding protein|nr:spermidine/putrescine transport system substrate-binding protein [Actinomycetota bacterium]
MAHPRERWTGKELDRRQFLARAAAAGVALPSLAAIMEACSNPREGTTSTSKDPAGDGGLWQPGWPYPLARQDKPVTWNIFPDNQPIASDLQPEKNATLEIYNWDQYIWPKIIGEFADKYNCDFKITTFNNMDEALAKMRTGQLSFDVFFPTIDVLGKLISSKLLQPLNQDYIPNLPANVWDTYQDPFYDAGWQYTVPYTIYTTGIGYRTDVISKDEIEAMSNPYDIFWDPKYKGQVGVYDDYREAISMTLLRHGITDLNTTDPATIQQAGQDLIDLLNATNVRTSINGAYVGIPKGQYQVHQAWSGDIAAAWFYVPQATMANYQTIGYWYPKDRVGAVNNDCLAIPANSKSPVLAHLFLDYMLDFKNAMNNFSWVGYQVPQKQADPQTLTTTKSVQGEPYIFPWLSEAVVQEEDFKTGFLELELEPSVDALWHEAWSQFQSG